MRETEFMRGIWYSYNSYIYLYIYIVSIGNFSPHEPQTVLPQYNRLRQSSLPSLITTVHKCTVRALE